MKRVDNGNSSKKTEEETEAKSSPTTVGGALSPQGGGTSGKTKGKKKKEKAERVLYEKDKVHHCIHVFTYLERLIDYPLPNLKVAVWAGLNREVGNLK